MKKLLAMLLAALMLFSVIGAVAEETAEAAVEETAETAVEEAEESVEAVEEEPDDADAFSEEILSAEDENGEDK